MNYESEAPNYGDTKASRTPAVPDAIDGLAKAVSVVEKNIDELMGRIVNICDQREIPGNPEPTLSQVRVGSSAVTLQLYEITDRLDHLARRIGLVRSRIET